MADMQSPVAKTEKNDSFSDDDALHNEKAEVNTADGNESGKVNTEKEGAGPSQWTFRRIIAVISLCLVYVGSSPMSNTIER